MPRWMSRVPRSSLSKRYFPRRPTSRIEQPATSRGSSGLTGQRSRPSRMSAPMRRLPPTRSATARRVVSTSGSSGTLDWVIDGGHAQEMGGLCWLPSGEEGEFLSVVVQRWWSPGRSHQQDSFRLTLAPATIRLHLVGGGGAGPSTYRGARA